jgi:predicted metal-dependent phosphoesterase TrpH
MSPTDLVKLAVAQNVKTIAITDHDTVDGVETATREGKKQNLRVVPGIEISSRYTGGTPHILGFGIDIRDPSLLKNLNEFQNIRTHRNEKIISKLQSLGIKISVDDIMHINPMLRSLGRPHIGSVLVKQGIVSNMNQAFIQYLGKQGKAFVAKDVITSEEAIRIIHDAGGLAILAHPATLNLPDRLFSDHIKNLVKEGLDGMEVFYSTHAPEQIQFYKSVCYKNDLLISAGSDFHGNNKKNIQLGVCNNGAKVTADMVSNELVTLAENGIS